MTYFFSTFAKILGFLSSRSWKSGRLLTCPAPMRKIFVVAEQFVTDNAVPVFLNNWVFFDKNGVVLNFSLLIPKFFL